MIGALAICQREPVRGELAFDPTEAAPGCHSPGCADFLVRVPSAVRDLVTFAD